ncbi:MAG: O-sialoglycoprotein endopeptidase [Clostridia bacterium]|nr:O-sialoglycoprotein endopeptidase [Clostridia bacterium]
MGLVLGFDTSCYTTSLACIDEKSIVLDKRTVLSVPLGGRGLRQSDALFQHNRNMPVLLESLFGAIDPSAVEAVGVSTRPVDAEDSYMPVFLAGILTAKAVAGALGVPLIETTHQMGHIRAASFGGNEEVLMRDRFLAMHLSGGTTDLVEVGTCDSKIISIEPFGKCTDLHAGQMVDRIAVALGCAFPGGPHLERIANEAVRKDIRIPVSVRGTDCSLSGAEAALMRLIGNGEDRCEVAYAVYDLLARMLAKLIRNAAEEKHCGTFLISGGVASSKLLRELLAVRLKGAADVRFGQNALSSDNAVGVALTAGDRIWNRTNP